MLNSEDALKCFRTVSSVCSNNGTIRITLVDKSNDKSLRGNEDGNVTTTSRIHPWSSDRDILKLLTKSSLRPLYSRRGDFNLTTCNGALGSVASLLASTLSI